MPVCFAKEKLNGMLWNATNCTTMPPYPNWLIQEYTMMCMKKESVTNNIWDIFNQFEV